MPGTITASGTVGGGASRLAYPAGSDTEALLETVVTLTVAQVTQLDNLTAAAAVEWERAVDLRPFLAGSADTTRRLDATTLKNGILLLDRPLAALTSISYQTIGDTSGTVLVPETEYHAEPTSATGDLRPYEQIAFAGHRWPSPLGYPYRGSVYVTGRWGYTTTVPDDVWEAIRSRAALKVFGLNRFGTTGGVSSLKEADRAVTYAPLAEALSAWKDAWTSAVRAYKNVGL